MKPKVIPDDKQNPRLGTPAAEYLDDRGRERPSPIPIEPPLGYRKTPTIAEQIRAMVRSEALAREAEAAGYETFEEADDFEIDDDPPDPESKYEKYFDPETGEPYPNPGPDPRNAPRPGAEPASNPQSPKSTPGADPTQ